MQYNVYGSYVILHGEFENICFYRNKYVLRALDPSEPRGGGSLHFGMWVIFAMKNQDL